MVWWAAASVVAAAALVVPWVVPDPETTVPAVLPVVLAVSVAAAALVGCVAVERGLLARPPTDERDATAEVTSRLVLQIALLEAPALLSVALAAFIGPPWVAAVGGLLALVGLVAIRPSDARLARLASRWRAAGADVDLLDHRSADGSR